VTPEVITTVLVANRGEIARRVFRTCRAMGLRSVAVYSEHDESAPYVTEADLAVPLPAGGLAETYLSSAAILEAARRSGADAIHPGYGFLSENADFAAACAAAGLVFIGPSPQAIAAMGDKLAAKERMAKAGVPALHSANVTGLSGAQLLAEGERIGYPVLVKAAFGGGGKGMRIVEEPGGLAEGVAAARREAAAAFGDGTVFLERYIRRARHVEIQVFGDGQGDVIALFERECSIQRRHQKIIEESPSPAVSPELRKARGAAAPDAARAIGYVGAGTVEFLLTDTGEFWFLEMNTRLQVEHPVTEMVTGLDLVRLQLLVAMGEGLPAPAREACITGHAIEARLYAEDPANGYLPATGRLDLFEIARPGLVRVDSGVESGSVVSIHYDPMLAKIIAHAPTRREAAALLAASLARSRVYGVSTNRDLLVQILRHPEFLAGQTDTGFLERHPPQELAAADDGQQQRLTLHALAAAIREQACNRQAATALASLPSGWRTLYSQFQQLRAEGPDSPLLVEYRFDRSGLTARLDGTELGPVRLISSSADHVDLVLDGLRWRVSVVAEGDTRYVRSALGETRLRILPRFPVRASEVPAGSRAAPMPGTIVRVAVSAGQQVVQGEVLVVMEAMKMELSVRATGAGVVIQVLAEEGKPVDRGAVLVVIDEDGE
jgi:propionyl-CoA carboxylase alpha chain